MKRGEKLLRSVYENRKLSVLLYVFSSFVSVLAAIAYCSVLLLFLLKHKYFEFLKLAISAGVPFLAVSFARKLINAKRPYEIYDFYERCPKISPFSNKTGEKLDTGASFPSKHAYSAFAIATLLFFSFPIMGIVLGVLALLMCASRVALGIHFLRDVLCGAAIGILAGVLGEFLFVI